MWQKMLCTVGFARNYQCARCCNSACELRSIDLAPSNVHTGLTVSPCTYSEMRSALRHEVRARTAHALM